MSDLEDGTGGDDGLRVRLHIREQLLAISLIIHGLLAVALLGALDAPSYIFDRAAAASDRRSRFCDALPRGTGRGLCGRGLRAVDRDFPFGAWIYTKYRVYVRIPIEQAGFWKTQGFFEMKEHLATIGLGLLPIYWYLWKNSWNANYDSARNG